MGIKTLETATAREAFKYFLLRELDRHLDDIFKIQKDLRLLEDVSAINEPLNQWIEASKKKEV